MRARRIIPIAITASLMACGTGTRPERAPAPAAMDASTQPDSSVASASRFRMISVCVVQGGALVTVTARFHSVTGDTTSPGVSGWSVIPRYVVDEPWFMEDEPITVQGRRFVKYGPPRVWQVGDVVRVGDHREWPVFAERGGEKDPAVVYVPLRSICEFQPYVLAEHAGGVRG